MNDLLCCPFCGGEPKYTDNYNENGTGHCVFCQNCGAGTAILTGSSPKSTLKSKVFELWNNRINCPYCGYNVSEQED